MVESPSGVNPSSRFGPILDSTAECSHFLADRLCMCLEHRRRGSTALASVGKSLLASRYYDREKNLEEGESSSLGLTQNRVNPHLATFVGEPEFAG